MKDFYLPMGSGRTEEYEGECLDGDELLAIAARDHHPELDDMLEQKFLLPYDEEVLPD